MLIGTGFEEKIMKLVEEKAKPGKIFGGGKKKNTKKIKKKNSVLSRK